MLVLLLIERVGGIAAFPARRKMETSKGYFGSKEWQESKAFWDTVNALNRFARVTQTDSRYYRDAIDAINRRINAYTVLLNRESADENATAIKERITECHAAISAINALMYSEDKNLDIFENARSRLITTENGNAETLIRELTEMARFYTNAKFGEESEAYPSYDPKACPVITTANGGVYRCHSPNPTISSEMGHLGGSALFCLKELEDGDLHPSPDA